MIFCTLKGVKGLYLRVMIPQENRKIFFIVNALKLLTKMLFEFEFSIVPK